jgi:3-deoxy-D-manno-octulosonic-acid transferase
MFLLYNLLQLAFLPVFAPLFLVAALITPRYRGRIIARLGVGTKKSVPQPSSGQMTIWVHALSVGEVTSAVPLLRGMRRKYPSGRIVLTVATRSGEAIARKMLGGIADHIIPSPLDFLPVIALFHARIRPQLFILVETDFWPNLLLYLRYKTTPAILVNGRVSEKSMKEYKRFVFFFRPMFRSFHYLFMQTKLDMQNMVNLGIDRGKIHVLGNLKFDTQVVGEQAVPSSISRLLPENKLVITAGSTHQGEETVLFDVITKLRVDHPQLLLILAPRNPDRADEICALAKQHGLSIMLRSQNSQASSNILLIDTIGELVSFYALSDIAFLGGSLVSEGGHNPIEPAILGIPVLFGPNMQDFMEIAVSLIKEGGGEQINDPETLKRSLASLLTSKELRRKRGAAAKNCVIRQRGVVDEHLELMQTLL